MFITSLLATPMHSLGREVLGKFFFFYMLLIRKYNGRLWKEEKFLTTHPRSSPLVLFHLEMAAVLEMKYVFNNVIEFHDFQPW